MFPVQIDNQPDDETCGPTSLKAVYKYYNYEMPLETIITEINRSLSGGTLAPTLGTHALKQGFKVTIYPNNLDLFDPTWFDKGRATTALLKRKLRAQVAFKRSKHFRQATDAYMEFLNAGGEIYFELLDIHLLTKLFAKKAPIITGLSATYLYGCARERYVHGQSYFDDVRGTPCGHFVVLCGFDEEVEQHIVVADPHRENPMSHDNYYSVDSRSLINAILLGILTYDANLLVIEPNNV